MGKATAHVQGFNKPQRQPVPKVPTLCHSAYIPVASLCSWLCMGKGYVANLRGFFFSEVFFSVIGNNPSSQPAIYCHMNFRKAGIVSVLVPQWFPAHSGYSANIH